MAVQVCLKSWVVAKPSNLPTGNPKKAKGGEPEIEEEMSPPATAVAPAPNAIAPNALLERL